MTWLVDMQGNLLLLHEKLMTEADFPLPRLGPKLKAMRENLRSGRGFQLIRGIPVDAWSNKESVIAYYGMGLYLGRANPQNRKGHLVGHIKVKPLQDCIWGYVSGAMLAVAGVSTARLSHRTL